MHTYRLSPPDLSRVTAEAALRSASAAALGSRDRHGLDRSKIDPDAQELLGCAGEYVVARLLGTFWPPCDGGGCPDLCSNVEVRTVSKPGRRLIVRPGDDLAAVWVLCWPSVLRGTAPAEIHVAGWLEGWQVPSRATLTQAGTNRPPAFFVSAERLRVDLMGLRAHACPELADLGSEASPLALAA